MKEKFKRYLEQEFRAIAPSREAMEFRQATLDKMMARVQELRIKGITDDQLICDMVISEMSGLHDEIMEFDKKSKAVKQIKRKSSFAVMFTVSAVAALVLAYLVTSFVTNAWADTWLILAGGALLGAAGVTVIAAVVSVNREKFLIARVAVAATVALVSVFIFLLLQILFDIPMSWIIFLVMVILIVGLDTVMAMVTENKLRFLELIAFSEVLGVMLYVILGVTGTLAWHPGWMLCLAGPVCAVILLIAFIVKRNEKKGGKDEKDGGDKEDYYTMWRD